MTPTHRLFQGYDLRHVLEQRLANAIAEVEAYDSNRLLNSSVDDLANYFVQKHSIQPPQLHEDQARISSKEIPINVSGFPDYDMAAWDHKPIPGLGVALEVPFTGDEFFFLTHPTTQTTIYPNAQIEKGFIAFRLSTSNPNANEIKRELERELTLTQRYLAWVRADIESFQNALPSRINTAIKQRRERLLRHAGVVAQLGYPLRERDDSVRTYAAPAVRRKIVVQPPVATSNPYVPEPALADAEYEHILGIIRSMARVLERSPAAFTKMHEEDLRQHFLVQLNGHYEGQATGETFNAGGKTDILIRVEDRNIFIAECKFWKGAKTLVSAIDQLLGYATWRDTKLAVLLFNRDREISKVLENIRAVVRQHPAFKREAASGQEGEIRAVLGHPDDRNRELILTVLTFEIPAT